jgi:hypothetical protein
VARAKKVAAETRRAVSALRAVAFWEMESKATQEELDRNGREEKRQMSEMEGWIDLSTQAIGGRARWRRIVCSFCCCEGHRVFTDSFEWLSSKINFDQVQLVYKH